MDEIRKVAKAYYNGAAGSEKELARKLFRSLDSNGDGKVSLREYKKMVKPSFSSNDLFKQLDANCDGTLDFDEVLALNYMDKVSVPRCNACNSLLLHSYFSCLPCQADVSYYLCCNCYAAGGDHYSHRHSSNNFIDTRAMLKLLDHLLKQAQITTNEGHQTHQGVEDGKLADVLTQGLALEEEAEDDSTEEDEDDEEEDEEEVEGEGEEEEEEGGEEDEEEGEVEVEGEKEDGDEEEDDDEDGNDEEDADGVDKCEVLNLNLMNYGKAVYKSQPESKTSNGRNKKSKKNDKAGKESKLRSGSEREKVLGAIEAVNNKVDSFKGKKEKVMGSVEAVNNKVVCLKEKKKKIVLGNNKVVCLKEKRKKIVLGSIESSVNNKVDFFKEKKEKVMGSIEAVNNKVVCLKDKKKKIVLGSIEAVNNKVISFKEKKKKVKRVISVGTAVVNIGAKAFASTLFHHVVRHRRNRN